MNSTANGFMRITVCRSTLKLFWNRKSVYFWLMIRNSEWQWRCCFSLIWNSYYYECVNLIIPPIHFSKCDFPFLYLFINNKHIISEVNISYCEHIGWLIWCAILFILEFILVHHRLVLTIQIPMISHWMLVYFLLSPFFAGIE